MQDSEHRHNFKFGAHRCSCNSHSEKSATGINRRGFLSGLAGTAAVGGLMLTTTSQVRAVSSKPFSSGIVFPHGTALRIKPVLTYQIEKRREKTSWRSYGGLQTRAQVNEEARIIKNELQKVVSQA